MDEVEFRVIRLYSEFIEKSTIYMLDLLCDEFLPNTPYDTLKLINDTIAYRNYKFCDVYDDDSLQAAYITVMNTVGELVQNNDFANILINALK